MKLFVTFAILFGSAFSIKVKQLAEVLSYEEPSQTNPPAPSEILEKCAFKESKAEISKSTDWVQSINEFYACGAKVRIDDIDSYEDDIGLSGLRIKFCHISNSSVYYHREVFPNGYDNNFWGDWSNWTDCTNGSYIAGISAKTYSNNGGPFPDKDDTGLEGLAILCKPKTCPPTAIVNPPLPGNNSYSLSGYNYETKLVGEVPGGLGTWGNWTIAGTGKYIDAAQAIYTYYLGLYDDRALTCIRAGVNEYYC